MYVILHVLVGFIFHRKQNLSCNTVIGDESQETSLRIPYVTIAGDAAASSPPSFSTSRGFMFRILDYEKLGARDSLFCTSHGIVLFTGMLLVYGIVHRQG